MSICESQSHPSDLLLTLILVDYGSIKLSAEISETSERDKGFKRGFVNKTICDTDVMSLVNCEIVTSQQPDDIYKSPKSR
jgi:hypothetical protein